MYSIDATAGGNPKNKKKYPEFTRADSLHGTLTRFRSCYDVRFYNISVAVFPETKSIKGLVSMDFFFVDSTQTVMQLDLSSKLDIFDISIDGTPIHDYRREYNAIFIKLPTNFSVAEEHRLTCEYGGTPVEAVRPPWEGGMVWKTSSAGKPWCGVTCETLGASCWLPCKDHLSDEPERGMRMRIDAPLGLTAVSNGMLVSHETVDNRELWTWQTNYTINSYNMTFYIGDFVNFGEEYHGLEDTFRLDYYVLPEDLEKAQASFAQTKNVIAAYEDFFGPYPWGKENFKLVESPYEGMEHQTAIAYGNGFKNSHFNFDYIIVHETAHEWWGNSVSVDDYADVFIHEGFAMYSEFLYVEKLYNRKESDRYAKIWSGSIKNIRPVVGPRDVNFWDYHDIDPYVKGAWCLKGLRYVMNNDSLFFDIIKSYNLSRRYKIVTVKDFTDYVNEKTGTDYSWYFNQYLYSEKQPVLEWRWIPRNEMAEYRDKVAFTLDVTDTIETLAPVSYMQLRWKNVDTSFKMPITFILKDSIGEKDPKIFVGNNLRDNQVVNIPITTDGVVIKKYGDLSGRILYFNTANSYFTNEKVKKFKDNETRNNNSKRSRR